MLVPFMSKPLTVPRARFATVLDNYKTTRANGGTFILLIHDLW